MVGELIALLSFTVAVIISLYDIVLNDVYQSLNVTIINVFNPQYSSSKNRLSNCKKLRDRSQNIYSLQIDSNLADSFINYGDSLQLQLELKKNESHRAAIEKECSFIQIELNFQNIQTHKVPDLNFSKKNFFIVKPDRFYLNRVNHLHVKVKICELQLDGLASECESITKSIYFYCLTKTHNRRLQSEAFDHTIEILSRPKLPLYASHIHQYSSIRIISPKSYLTYYYPHCHQNDDFHSLYPVVKMPCLSLDNSFAAMELILRIPLWYMLMNNLRIILLIKDKRFDITPLIQSQIDVTSPDYLQLLTTLLVKDLNIRLPHFKTQRHNQSIDNSEETFEFNANEYYNLLKTAVETFNKLTNGDDYMNAIGKSSNVYRHNLEFKVNLQDFIAGPQDLEVILGMQSSATMQQNDYGSFNNLINIIESDVVRFNVDIA